MTVPSQIVTRSTSATDSMHCHWTRKMLSPSGPPSALPSGSLPVGRRKPICKPWLSDGAFDIIQQKLTAQKQNDQKERNRLKRLFDKTAKVDRERFFNRIADDTEAGVLQNDLRAAYRTINVLGGCTQAQHSGIPINDASGVPCKSEEEILRRWAEHYRQALNHPSGLPFHELDDHASNALHI